MQKKGLFQTLVKVQLNILGIIDILSIQFPYSILFFLYLKILYTNVVKIIIVYTEKSLFIKLLTCKQGIQ